MRVEHGNEVSRMRIGGGGRGGGKGHVAFIGRWLRSRGTMAAVSAVGRDSATSVRISTFLLLDVILHRLMDPPWGGFTIHHPLAH